MITNAISDKHYITDQRNALRRPKFDTYKLAASTATPTKIVMFDAPMSSTKGANLTNMTKPYELGPGERLTMYSLRVVPVGMDDADIIALMKNYTLRFMVNRAPLLEAPIEYFAGGAGLAGCVATTATTTTVKQFTNGVASPQAVLDFGDFPIVIDSGDHIEVNLLGDTFTSTAAIFLRVYLDGLLEGLVQGF